MGAPVGNQNARKAKVWEQALKRALARLSNESVDAGLDIIADKVVAAAVLGDAFAVKEISERMDGKAHQSVDVAATVDATIQGGLAPIYGLHPTPET